MELTHFKSGDNPTITGTTDMLVITAAGKFCIAPRSRVVNCTGAIREQSKLWIIAIDLQGDYSIVIHCSEKDLPGLLGELRNFFGCEFGALNSSLLVAGGQNVSNESA